MSILILKNDGAGDLILASGLISHLSETLRRPIDLVTCESNRGIGEAIAGVQRVLYVSRDNLRFRSRPAAYGLDWPVIKGADRNVIRALRNTDYELAVCLRRFIRASTLVLMGQVCAHRKLTFWQFPTNATFEQTARWTRGWEHHAGRSETLHECEYYRECFVSALNIDLSMQPRLSFCTPASTEPVQDRVGLIISGMSTSWPESYWIQLTELLTANGYKVFLFGGPTELELATTLQFHFPTIASFVGKLKWSESAAELGKVGMVIGNDTGLTHLASLISRKVIVIQGGGTFGRFFPWPGARNQYLLYRDMECFDCDWKCIFPRRYCVTSLTPTQVFSYAESIRHGDTNEFMRNIAHAAEKAPGAH